MTRHGLTILLQWSILMLVLIMIKGGTAAPAVRWALVPAGFIWVGMVLTYGRLGKPGLKLQGSLRLAHPWMHRGLYALLAIAIAANTAAFLGLAHHDTGWDAFLVLLCAATFHGLFHIWRHNTLFDGALRAMTPRFMHKIL